MSPTFSPFQYTIQATIDDTTIDYMLTVDETGHVYEARPMVFELPEMGQKLLFSGTNGQLEEKVRAFARLSSFILPLRLEGKATRYEEAFAPLVQKINKRLNERGYKWRDLHGHAVPGSIASKLLGVLNLSLSESRKQRYKWMQIGLVIQNLKGEISSDFVQSLSEEHPDIAADFLPAIIPFLLPGARRASYEALGNIKTAAVQRYLLSALELPYAQHFAIPIFKALKGYPPTDVQISDAAIRFYHRPKDMPIPILPLTLELASHYPSTQAKAFAYEILQLNNKYSAVHAARALLRMHTPPQQITDIAIPLFMAADPDRSETAFRILALEELPAAYLPEAMKVLGIIVDTLSQRRNSSIINALPSLALKTGLYHYPDSICQLLTHEAPAVREGMLRLIRDAFQMKDVDIRPFVGEELLKQYLALAYDNNDEVAQYAITLIGIICSGKKIKTYISTLLELYQQKSKDDVKLEILKAINSILSVVGYQAQIEPVYLSALENRNPNYRIEGLRGLRFSPDTALKNKLLIYKKDFVKSVREEAEQLFNVPNKTLLIHTQKENRWWDSITKPHGGNLDENSIN